MVIFSVLAQTVYGSLQGLGKLYVPGICLAIGAFVKYLINVIFVPIYAEVVPAISTVIYNFIAFSLSFYILFKYIKEKPNIKELFVKPFIASCIMAIVTAISYKIILIVTNSNAISTLISIAIAILIYLITVVKINALTYNEMTQLPYGNKICKLIYKTRK
jgi:O-antigen/teichoic acid export membrane protein